MKSKIISVIILIIWLFIIFLFSAMPSDQSNDSSKGIIYSLTKNTITITNNIGITHINNDKINEITEKLNYPLRKVLHFTEYFILATILIIVLNKYNISVNKVCIITIIICFIYAITDEIHQLYVTDRTSQPLDVLIDTLGSIFALFIYRKKIKQ